MPKPIKVDLPYPRVSKACSDIHSATIISPAYCGPYGELSAVLGYTYQKFNFVSACEEQTAELFQGIAIAEMHHFDILGETLSSLGVDPVFTVCPPFKSEFYNTSSLTYSRYTQKMFMDAITRELVAINEYKGMIKRLKNEQVSAIIERIILDEELHVEVLKERFNTYNIKILY